MVAVWWLFDSPEFIRRLRYPNAATIELTNVCNLRCEVCPVHISKREKGFLSLDNFKKIVDKLPASVKKLDFTYAGEPTLNKDCFKMVRYAARKGMRAEISTNGTQLHRFALEEILNPNLTLCICLDGATAKTHETYRRNSDFKTIVGNIKRIASAPRPAGMEVVMQSLLWNRSIQELRQLKRLAKELGVDRLSLRYFSLLGVDTSDRGVLKRVHPDYIGNDDKGLRRLFRKYIPTGKDKEYSLYDHGRIRFRMSRCPASSSMLVLWNGDVAPCCHCGESAHRYGNLLNESFDEVMRKQPRKQIESCKLDVCKICTYSDLQNYAELTRKTLQKA